MMKYILLTLTLLLIISCNPQDINQEKFRTENYIWFVEDGTTKGEWIKADNYKDKNYIKNGHCTTFYKNGTIREKYYLDKLGKMDTIFNYDLKEKLTHFSYNVYSEELKNIFVEDGEFKSYSANEELILSGTVVDKNLEKYEFHGEMKTFFSLVKKNKKDWDKFNKLVIAITKVIKERSKNNTLKISEEKLEKLDAIRLVTLQFTEKTLQDLKQIKPNENEEDLLSASIDMILLNKNILEKDIKNLLQTMSLDFTDENIALMRNITIDFLERTSAADKRLEKEQVDFKRKQHIGEYFLPLFKKEID